MMKHFGNVCFLSGGLTQSPPGWFNTNTNTKSCNKTIKYIIVWSNTKYFVQMNNQNILSFNILISLTASKSKCFIEMCIGTYSYISHLQSHPSSCSIKST